MKGMVLVAIAALGLCASEGSARTPQVHDVARRMEAAATAFLAGLSAEQRAACSFALDDAERTEWDYVPRARRGVPLKALDAAQRRLALDLLRTGVSEGGYVRVSGIMFLETVLREIETNGPVRDPDLYYVSVFGAPSATAPWAWRVEGHHLSLNFTVAGGRAVASTPSFFGSNPAEVRTGPKRGLRVLAAEEDAGYALLHALRDDQRAKAIFDMTAPPDIVTMKAKAVDPLAPVGIAASELDSRQTEALIRLLDAFASAMPHAIAEERLAKIRRAGLEQLHFGWAGAAQPGQGHYFRVQGPTFILELDNTQNNANHVHTVWRDYAGDFGRDLLLEHYRTTPHGH
jgi:hypothetical protein